jgi:hypothetical protein
VRVGISQKSKQQQHKQKGRGNPPPSYIPFHNFSASFFTAPARPVSACGFTGSLQPAGGLTNRTGASSGGGTAACGGGGGGGGVVSASAVVVSASAGVGVVVDAALLGSASHKTQRRGRALVVPNKLGQHRKHLSILQYFPKLVSPLILFDSFTNPNCQGRLVHIGSYSGVPLSVEPVLFFTLSNQVYSVVYTLIILIQPIPRYPTLGLRALVRVDINNQPLVFTPR